MSERTRPDAEDAPDEVQDGEPQEQVRLPAVQPRATRAPAVGLIQWNLPSTNSNRESGGHCGRWAFLGIKMVACWFQDIGHKGDPARELRERPPT